MSKRIDKSWIVLASLENEEHDRCIDLFRRPDGSHGFEEFRRDPEDAGANGRLCPITPAYVSPPKREALAEATRNVAWLKDCCQ